MGSAAQGFGQGSRDVVVIMLSAHGIDNNQFGLAGLYPTSQTNISLRDIDLMDRRAGRRRQLDSCNVKSLPRSDVAASRVRVLRRN